MNTEKLLSKIAAGEALTAEEMLYILANKDNRWHEVELRGSQATPRGVQLSRWTQHGKDRLYIDTRIFSRTPRSGKIGYIDLQTGAIVPDRNGSKREMADAVESVLAGVPTRIHVGYGGQILRGEAA